MRHCACSAGLGLFFGGPLPGVPPVINAELTFTWGANLGATPNAETSCRNTEELLSTNTRECGPGEAPASITCKSTGCGRPVDWPEDEPFFLPVDLQARAHCSCCKLLASPLSAASLLSSIVMALRPHEYQSRTHCTRVSGVMAWCVRGLASTDQQYKPPHAQ